MKMYTFASFEDFSDRLVRLGEGAKKSVEVEYRGI